MVSFFIPAVSLQLIKEEGYFPTLEQCLTKRKVLKNWLSRNEELPIDMGGIFKKQISLVLADNPQNL